MVSDPHNLVRTIQRVMKNVANTAGITKPPNSARPSPYVFNPLDPQGRIHPCEPVYPGSRPPFDNGNLSEHEPPAGTGGVSEEVVTILG